MRILYAACLVALLLSPMAAAHHPGSVGGLSAYAPADERLVHRITDVETSFQAWDAAYPEFVERQTVGATGILQLPLLAIRITNESIPFDAAATATGQKVRVYIDGGHHGNEFLGVDLTMYYLEQLLSERNDDATAQFLQTHEVWALPIVNVEGNTLDTRKNANQVDPNRNYGFEWGGPGSGDFIFELNYRGPAAFSEPEVAANAEFARTLMPDLWITMHTGVAEFYWPWGWTFDKSPDAAFFESLEAPFEAATNGEVDAMMAAELYLAAGATDDWGYGQLGIPTHTFEVHDSQFAPVFGQPIPQMLENQLSGLDFAVKNATVWGAWVTLHSDGQQLFVQNDGWGEAQNVTLLHGDESRIIPRIGPGQSVSVPLASDTATVQYKQLVIDAPEAKTRTVQWTGATSSASQDAPGVPVVLLATLLFAAVVLHRTRSPRN